MLIRNLDPANGHVNGARYTICGLSKRIIRAKIACGPHAGKEIMIPRILFHPKDKNIPFEMERRQFPIRVCLSITANKSQGQSYKVVGLNLTKDFFAHGQLYVAMSRVQSRQALKIYKPLNHPHKEYMKNVVYKEILSKDPQVKNSSVHENDPEFSFELDDDYQWSEFHSQQSEDVQSLILTKEMNRKEFQDEMENGQDMDSKIEHI